MGKQFIKVIIHKKVLLHTCKYCHNVGGGRKGEQVSTRGVYFKGGCYLKGEAS